MKEVHIKISDEAIKDLWNMREKCGLNLNNETFEEYKEKIKKRIEK